jgi:iron(III) transport system ATP-binding protein
MKDGEIQQVGSPREIYNQPRSSFVADFIGTANFLDGVVESIEPSGSVKVMTEFGPIQCRTGKSFQRNDPVLISFRPEDVIIHDDGLPHDGVNTFGGKVTASIFSGDYSEVRVNVMERRLRIKVAGDRTIQRGDDITLTINPDKTLVVEKREAQRAEALAADA